MVSCAAYSGFSCSRGIRHWPMNACSMQIMLLFLSLAQVSAESEHHNRKREHHIRRRRLPYGSGEHVARPEEDPRRFPAPWPPPDDDRFVPPPDHNRFVPPPDNHRFAPPPERDHENDRPGQHRRETKTKSMSMSMSLTLWRHSWMLSKVMALLLLSCFAKCAYTRLRRRCTRSRGAVIAGTAALGTDLVIPGQPGDIEVALVSGRETLEATVEHDSSVEDEADGVGLLALRRQNLQIEGSARQSFGSSSMVETVSMLTEDLFNRTKMYGIMKLGVYEHWTIKPQDIEVEGLAAGRGAFGIVSRGLLYGGTDVAVKMAMSVNKDQGLLALANEVRLLRRIRHLNIVLFHGVLIDNENMCLSLVLEWVDGANLERYIIDTEDGGKPRDRRLPTQARKLLTDTARGMQYLHAQQPLILHRDLKPSNILVETVVSPPRAKIADFGLSVLMKADGHTQRAGTLAYMAPEVQRSEVYSASADVWSFGCVALFSWAGKHPSTAVYEEMCEAHTDTVHFQRLAAVAHQSLQPRPQDRPAFSVILKALQEDGPKSALNGLPDAERSPSQKNSDKSTAAGFSAPEPEPAPAIDDSKSRPTSGEAVVSIDTQGTQ